MKKEYDWKTLLRFFNDGEVGKEKTKFLKEHNTVLDEVENNYFTYLEIVTDEANNLFDCLIDNRLNKLDAVDFIENYSVYREYYYQLIDKWIDKSAEKYFSRLHNTYIFAKHILLDE